MGFFGDLKSDLTQAYKTLMPEDKPEDTQTPDNGNGAESDKKSVDIDSMLNRLDDIKLDEVREESASEPVKEEKETAFEVADKAEVVAEKVQEVVEPVPEPVKETVTPVEPVKSVADELSDEAKAADIEKALEEKIEEQTVSELEEQEPKSAIEAINPAHLNKYVANVNEETEKITNNGGIETMDFEQQTPTDEVASITEGMIVKGDIQTTGSLDLVGKITGNIKCLGKLNVTGEIVGDSDAAEIYAESARITGEVKSKGSVKVGQSTVIVGNIFGSSAVIAGAVKGDIDVHGPVVLDTTAIVMGNIKSQSVQINNGAVIEGMCSQAYADVNPSEFFETLKNR